MTTLLNTKTKKELKMDYFSRFLMVTLSFSIAILSVWVVMTWSLSFALNSREMELRQSIEATSQGAVTVLLRDYKKMLSETSSKLDLFERGYGSKDEVLRFVFNVKPQNIIFDSISINETEKVSFVELRGEADSRETLIFFKRLLEENEMIENFNLPLSSFAKNESIPFTISFQYKYK